MASKRSPRAAAAAAAFAAAIATASAAVPPGAAVHWHFNQGVGDLAVLDGEGSHDGVLVGAAIVRAGYEGNALFCDGSDSHAEFAGTETLLAGENWSISLWFRQRNQTSGGSRLRTILGSGNAGNGGGVAISAERSNAGNLQFRIGANEVYLPAEWDLAWHHVAFVRSGSTAHAWVDGVAIGSLAAGDPVLDAIRLGRDGSTDVSRHFDGFIDDVRIYGRSLTAEEIGDLGNLHPLPPRVSIPYTTGTMGYSCFRIPSVLRAANGDILAFAEGRVNSCSDTGNIDLVMRRSTDGGATWQPLQIVWDDGPNTCGNPAPLVDRDTGRIWMAMTHNLGQDSQTEISDGTSDGTRTVWIAYSDDNGDTWTEAEEVTPFVKDPTWRWYATGPGVGMQSSDGTLFVPANRNNGSGVSGAYSLVFASTDHGATWQRRGEAGTQVSEAQVVELSDGGLLLDMRRAGSRPLSRATTRSSDAGMTWAAVEHDDELPSTAVQASILRHTRHDLHDVDRILFCNPANNATATADSRTRMTVRASEDEGGTWAHGRELYSGWSAYSCLTVASDWSIGCLYEWGDDARYERFVFERFGLDWLTAGAEANPDLPLPPDVQLVNADAAGAMIAWAPVDGAEGYEVLRYDEGADGSASIVGTVDGSEFEFHDPAPGGSRWYRVRAFNGVGRSMDSEPVHVTTEAVASTPASWQVF